MVSSRAGGARAALVVLLASAMACSKPGDQASQTAQAAPPVDHRAADEAIIRANDSAWVKAVAAKNVDQSTSLYADDASFMAPGAPLATGKEAIRKGWTTMFATPGLVLTFAPDKIVVGTDMAYDLGSYQEKFTDKKGKTQSAAGKYVVVWGKQPDGSWKVLVDAPTTTN